MRSFALLSMFSAVSVVSGATPPAATRTSVKDAAAAYGYDLSAVLETVDVTGDGKLLKHVLVRGSGDTARKVRAQPDVLLAIEQMTVCQCGISANAGTWPGWTRIVGCPVEAGWLESIHNSSAPCARNE